MRVDHGWELACVEHAAVYQVELRVAPLASGVLNLSGLDCLLLRRDALVSQVVRVHLQRFMLLPSVGQRSSSTIQDPAVLLVAKLLFEPIIRAGPEVVASTVY